MTGSLDNYQPLWSGDDFLAGTKGRSARMDMPPAITGISIDTRTLEPGDAFFAIQGDQFDGHDFLTAAKKAGAACAVVAKGKLPALGAHQMPLVVVPNVLEALEHLGRAARERTSARICAVTGSAGKTTTKEALRHVLEGAGRTHASPASFNNHWGVPLTLARMPRDTEFGVFEIGMNHPGEITPLVAMVRPHVSMVTTIAAAHLGQFASLDAIAEAKAEIFTGMVDGGTAVINGDIDQTELLKTRAKQAKSGSILTFGEGSQNHTQLTGKTMSSTGSRFSALVSGGAIDVILPLPGRHQIQNMLGLLTTCDLFGVDLQLAAERLSKLHAGKGRGETSKIRLPDGSATLIDEAYNANPQAISALIEVLAGTKPGGDGRRILVLGDMLELGDHSRKLHEDVAGEVMSAGIDLVFSAGPEMKYMHDALDASVRGGYAADAAALVPLLKSALKAGDIVAVKASNGMKFGQLVEALKAFDS
jgi:UDP-N-acetylmuramoyl-tripeptide--D-alanyl-D-alanine ligase